MFRRTKKTSNKHSIEPASSRGMGTGNNELENGCNGVNDLNGYEKFSNIRGVHILREPHINKVRLDFKYNDTKNRYQLQEYCDFFSCLRKALLAFLSIAEANELHGAPSSIHINQDL